MSTGSNPSDPSQVPTAGAAVLPALSLATLTERPGTVIGRYTLIEVIGAGGFGSVFLAEQSEPVARRVALKILKLGMDTVQVIARFEQERQALAVMDHPHIAKVLDAGATVTGRPFFVMELVTGEPITSFCDAHGLSVRRRLDLFVQVCNAIQHAHQKGIIHRDIKPSNVLVSMHDGRPHAKIIDFGIAKATEQTPGGESMHTRLGQWLGTPLYMSPEQSVGAADVDTRSDVYSLGVLLYELLTGSTPFAATSEDDTSELQRLIREVDPPRPSTRVSDSGDSLPQLAASRATDPKRLRSLLKGELDWIAMKAIEKEPERRYQTANALALDVLRFLAAEPVVAAPPSAAYRLRKFLTRHRGPVIGAAVVLLALVGGLVSTLKQRDAARREAARATALADFMTEMLTASNPEGSGARDVTVAEILSRASRSASETLRDQPQAEAEARTLLGQTFRALGKPDEAEAELERAVALRERGDANDPAAHARALRTLGIVHRERGELEDALSYYERASAVLVGDDPAQIDERVTVEYEMGLVLSAAARYAEAEQHLDTGDRLLDSLPPADSDQRRAQILTARAVIAENWKGDLAEAERLSSEALRLQREALALGTSGSHPHIVADAINSLALIENSRGKYDEAIALYEEAIAINRKTYGERHPVVAVNLENLGSVYMRIDQSEKTLSLLDEVLAIRIAHFGEDSAPVARTRFNMGVVTARRGDHARAYELLDSGLAAFRRHYGEESLEAGIAHLHRGMSSEALGRFDAARRDYRSSLAIIDQLASPTDSTRLNALEHLARLDCREGATAGGLASVELGLAVLDASNADQRTWIERFEEARALCDGSG